jgi:hypothetical protein
MRVAILSAAALSLAVAGCTGDTEDPPAPILNEPAPTPNEPTPAATQQAPAQPPQVPATQLTIKSFNDDPHAEPGHGG